MSVGFPDYARLSEQGGFLLYSNSGNLPEFTTLFNGYVGSWPYINVVTLMGASADFAQINFDYASDSTFATLVGERFAIRTGGSFAITQYANMSPWLKLFYNSQSGATMPFDFFAVYGSEGPAGQVQLASFDVPISGGIQAVAANSTVVVTPQHIQPGDANFTIQTAAASWFAFIEYYNYGTNSWTRIYQVGPQSAPGSFSFDWPMIDAPHRITFSNNTASSTNFVYSWISK